MIEFVQTYPGGDRVLKRAVEASPTVISEQGIDAQGVSVFTTAHGANTAMSVFHFHPGIPADERRDRMTMDTEGVNLIRFKRAARQDQRRQARTRTRAAMAQAS